MCMKYAKCYWSSLDLYNRKNNSISPYLATPTITVRNFLFFLITLLQSIYRHPIGFFLFLVFYITFRINRIWRSRLKIDLSAVGLADHEVELMTVWIFAVVVGCFLIVWFAHLKQYYNQLTSVYSMTVAEKVDYELYK